LQNELKSRQIELKFKYKGQTDVIQGISFVKNDTTFKGSEVDRSFSFANIDKQLTENNKLPNQKQCVEPNREEAVQKPTSMIDFGTGFFDFPVNPLENDEYDPNRLKKKKKKRLKL